MKKIKKALKIIFISCVGLGLIALSSTAIYYYHVTHAVSLDTTKLDDSISTSFEIIDRNNNRVSPSSEAYINVNDLNSYTKDAFISAEDKRFYSHHGIDYLRLGGAVVSNIKTRSFSQGASTISQQLIKNSQLSSEKTIKRKMKEFKLTRQLEKKYSKDDILQMYLNNIYFGNGCYGIENASVHYFGKPANKLTLAESAILAGTINAPSVYDIENNTEKAVNRRNLILKLMLSHGKISNEQYNSAIAEPVTLNLTKLSNSHYIYKEIIKEACNILKMTENELKLSGLKIHTYHNQSLNQKMNEIISSSNSGVQNIASIVVDNKTGGVVACVGGSALQTNHQPGSAIKPLLIYAPAIENNLISPATKILDEKVNFGGYSPDNADKKFHGFVSARDALKNSYNVPAVKLLNELGIKNAQNFAENLGIKFSESDNNLAIALGGFTDGIKLKDLADAYATLARNGKFVTSTYISKITKNNITIFEDSKTQKEVMKDSTAYLVTNMLTDTVKSGTARRLKGFDFDIASKTGTVGKVNSSKNTDAYNIAYTSTHTIVSYFGDDEMPENINGATYPTMLTKDVISILYKNSKPENFDMPDSVCKMPISKSKYEQNILSVASNSESSFEEYFSKDNVPETSKSFALNPNIQVFNFENKKPIICFFGNENYSYKIIRKKEAEESIISSAQMIDSKNIKFEDKSANSNEIYEYFVEFCEKSTNKTIKSNSVKLKSF